MNKKTISTIVLVAVVVGVLSFFGGMKYGQSTALASANPNGQGASQGRNFGAGGRGGGPGRGGFTGGQIVSIDKNSMTISARDGSSKIIFFTTATPVMKMVAGTLADLLVGKDVAINGQANSDGSITADSIQLRTAPMGDSATQTPKN